MIALTEIPSWALIGELVDLEPLGHKQCIATALTLWGRVSSPWGAGDSSLFLWPCFPGGEEAVKFVKC